MNLRRSLVALALSFAAMTCPWAQDATTPTGSTTSPIALSCGQGQSPMRRIELIFGAASPKGPIGEREWRRFLAKIVTPRLPDGLTVVPAYGQWRGTNGRIVREASRILLVWAQDTDKLDGKIEEIRLAYKTRFQQSSVMRIDSQDCVGF